MSKQAASQLLDTLVTRGYVRRSLDPVDRRRMIVTLTLRGAEAAVAQAAGVERVDAGLAQHVARRTWRRQGACSQLSSTSAACPGSSTGRGQRTIS